MKGNEGLIDYDALETPVEIPVRYRGVNYVLRQASGGAAVKYRNECISRATITTDGRMLAGKNMADVEPILVSLCLFQVDPENPEKLNPVSVETVKGFAAPVLRDLYDRARKISKLRDTQEPDLREKLIKALDYAESPMSADDLRNWVHSLGDDFRDLSEWLDPTDEETAKN